MKAIFDFLKDIFDAELVGILMLSCVAVGVATAVGVAVALDRSLSDLDQSLIRLESAIDELDRTLGR